MRIRKQMTLAGKTIMTLGLVTNVAFPFSNLYASGNERAVYLQQTLQQSKQALSGSVVDEYGDPVIGATVIVKNSNSGTITDMDGNFVIQTKEPVGKGRKVIISFVGYKDLEVEYKGIPLKVVLKENVQQLNDVVVTALGIKREEKGLGYSTQMISDQMITGAMPSNWSTALSGKVAGLNIVSPGGPVSTTRITLRGDVSLNQNGNNALIVVNGVPMSNTITNTGSAYGAGDNAELPVDYGNGFSDLNPDDIESIQVLKGASATALYGTRAANGVIMVTTKSGSNHTKNGVGVTFSSNMSMDKAMHFPDYQYEFGQGLPSYIGKTGTEYEGRQFYSYGAANGNSSTSGTSSAYGPRFDASQLYFQYDPALQGRAEVATPWVGYDDNRTGLFQTGYTLTNSVAVNGKTDKGSMRAALTHAKNEWILPNTGFTRLTASVSANQQVSKYLRLNMNTSYTHRDIKNTPALGYNSNSISYFLIFQNPNVNLDWLRPKWRAGKENVKQLQPYSTYIGNPFVTLYESTNPSKKNSVVSNLSATVTFNRKLELMLRSGIQLSNDERQQRRPVSDVVFGNGFFKEQSVFDFETNSDALLTFRDTFSNGLKMNISLGGNMMYSRYKSLAASVVGLVTPGVYKLTNGASAPHVVSYLKEKALNSVYAAANFSWKDKIFLDVTGRNDWSSTLPASNRSFFYPSVSTSVLLNELFSMPEQFSILKVRGSWAQVGNDTEPYKTGLYYQASDFPGSVTNPTTLFNADFKPEISTSYEAGADLRMFNNRLGVDFTFYYNQTRNQIIDAPMDPTTGYSRATINSGNVRNRGYELQLTATPVQKNDFRWNTTVTWSRNENKILSLAEGMDENQLIGSVGTVSVIGRVGGSTGDLWGYKVARNEYGEPLIQANGLPAQSNELEYVGSAYPAWKAGFINEFSYKGFRVSIQLDGQVGGIVYSQAHHKMTEQGKLKHTLNGRLPGTQHYMAADDPRIAAAGLAPLDGAYMIAPGVVKNADGSYSPNTKVVTVESYYKEQYRRANVETNSFDASYLKLREARIEYSFSNRILRKTPFQSLSLAVYGRNLAMWTKFPLFDPEAAALNGGSIVPGVEMGQLPSARNYGFNLNVTF